MTKPFPHHYEVQLVSDDGRGIVTAPPRPFILGGPPPEFDGRDGWWSPEHLLLSSLALCLFTTFQVFARRSGLKIQGYASRVDSTLDKTPGGIGFTSIVVHVDLRVAPADREKADQLLLAAKRHCIVSNALKTDVQIETAVNVVAA